MHSTEAPLKYRTNINIHRGRNSRLAGKFNTTLTSMDRSIPDRIPIKKTMVLNDILNQMDLIHIYRTFYPKIAKYEFFLSVHGTFFRIDHVRPQNKSQ